MQYVLDHHYQVPVLGYLPAAFSSDSAVLTGSDICELLLEEYLSHSSNDDVSQMFPRGSDVFIGKVLSEVISFILFEYDRVFSSYTSPLIRSVFGWNLVTGTIETHRLRERVLSSRASSTIHSMDECVAGIKQVIDVLSESVDLCESMNLPMRITCKLFACMSVLLSIPLRIESPVGIYIFNSPQMAAIRTWCDRINKGTKIWPQDWLDQKVEQKPSMWEQIFGPPSPPSPVNKSQNVIFLMSSAAMLFVYLATQK